jgi:hypothetical protein
VSSFDRDEGISRRVERVNPVLFNVFHVDNSSLRRFADIGTCADPDP